VHIVCPRRPSGEPRAFLWSQTLEFHRPASVAHSANDRIDTGQAWSSTWVQIFVGLDSGVITGASIR